jgi:hypothetical protein
MSDPIFDSPPTPGEPARLSAQRKLTVIEQGKDSIMAGLATHIIRVMSESRTHQRILQCQTVGGVSIC